MNEFLTNKTISVILDAWTDCRMNHDIGLKWQCLTEEFELVSGSLGIIDTNGMADSNTLRNAVETLIKRASLNLQQVFYYL